jgi:monothiol glutaredoxin
VKDILAQYLNEDVMQSLFNRTAGEAPSAIERIQSYLNGNSIVLFMKGSPEMPQCGFSARVVSALRACEATFTHVDVLDDPELRQTLKSYSNWPTIPQLYIQGQLIGGCDIVMELFESGDLLRMVEQASVLLP